MTRTHSTKTVCRSCGTVAYEYRERLYVPIEDLVLTGRLTGNDPLVERYAFLPHTCEDSAVEEYAQLTAAVMAEMERLRDERRSPWSQADYVDAQQSARASYEQLRELIAQHSLEHECPRCSAPVGARCANLTERKRGNEVPTRNPHDERVPDVEQMPQSELARTQQRFSEQQSLAHRIYQSLHDEDAVRKILRQVQRESRHVS